MTKQEITTLVEQLTVAGNKLNKKVVSEFKVVELKKMASFLQIKGYSKLLKKELVEEVLKMLLRLQEDNKRCQSKNDKSTAVAYKTLSVSNKLTRDEFRKVFIQPLEYAFGYKTYWSGKESESAGLNKINGNYHGRSFTSRINAPIVISLRANQQDTLRTLIHEYAHSILHRIGTEGRKLISAEKEIEAETVAKTVIENLGLTYTNTWYIPYYQEKYIKKIGKKYIMSDLRKRTIDSVISKITKVMVPTSETAKGLIGKEEIIKKNNARNPYKYEVCCPTCTNSWKYKSKGKTVKNAHKYFCTSCGKEKTLGKFIVKEL